MLKSVISRLVRLNPMKLGFIPDGLYLHFKFYDAFGRWGNFRTPTTFNEKLQWLKMHDRRPEYTTMVDKYNAKKYIADIIGPKYIIPTIGVWDNFEQIDFSLLPERFVLKCTHDSGGLVICSDKSKLDMNAVRSKIEISLKNKYYYMGREWPYKNVKPRIIAEQYMGDDLFDHRLFDHDAIPRMRLVCSECIARTELQDIFYDASWNHMNEQQDNDRNAIFPMARPMQYMAMKKLASAIAKCSPLVRIDFYEINQRVYFGETMFQQNASFENLDLTAFNMELGNWCRIANGYKCQIDRIDFILSTPLEFSQRNKSIVDYKFFCFDGQVESVMVCTDRETGDPKFYFFDRDWNLKRYNIRGKNAPEGFTLPKPPRIDEMFDISARLSKGIPYVRVDLYCINDKVYFGEMTFYPDSGMDNNLLKESDEYWGRMLVLPDKCI